MSIVLYEKWRVQFFSYFWMLIDDLLKMRLVPKQVPFPRCLTLRPFSCDNIGLQDLSSNLSISSYERVLSPGEGSEEDISKKKVISKNDEKHTDENSE